MTNDLIMAAIGRRLARRRRELDLSLAGVAQRCGVSLQQIHKYETGQSTVSAPMLYRLANCLGVSVGWFFEELDVPEKVGAGEVGSRPGG